jgi:hypothetical protein
MEMVGKHTFLLGYCLCGKASSSAMEPYVSFPNPRISKSINNLFTQKKTTRVSSLLKALLNGSDILVYYSLKYKILKFRRPIQGMDSPWASHVYVKLFDKAPHLESTKFLSFLFML